MKKCINRAVICLLLLFGMGSIVSAQETNSFRIGSFHSAKGFGVCYEQIIDEYNFDSFCLYADMGGVLIDLFYDRCVAAYKALGFNDICNYLDPCHQKGIYGDMESGKASEDEFYDFFLSKCHEGTTRQDIDACMKSFYEGPSEKTGELLKSLKQKGYGIYMLSNNNPIMMRICDSDFKKVGIGISDFFDQAFISSSMKMMKPDAAIFNEAIKRIGLNANELLFIDDSQVNVSAARRAGMNAILYTPGEDLAQVIEKALR